MRLLLSLIFKTHKSLIIWVDCALELRNLSRIYSLEFVTNQHVNVTICFKFVRESLMRLISIDS